MKTDNTAKPTGPWKIDHSQTFNSITANRWHVNIDSFDGKEIIAVVNGKTKEEAEVRATLIAEAGTIYNETNLFPRELMERYTEAVSVLQKVRTWYETRSSLFLGEETPVCFSEALSVILKAKGPNKG